MAIELRDELKQKLKQRISETLHIIRTEHGSFIDRKSMDNLFRLDSLIANKQVGKLLQSYIGDNPLFDFVSQVITRDVRDTQDFEKGKAKALTELIEFSNPSDYAEKLLSELCSLPWRYMFSFRLPRDLHSLIDGRENQIAISPTIRFVRAGNGFGKEFPLQSKISRRNEYGGILSRTLLDSSPPEWKPEDVVCQIEDTGFVGVYDYSVPLQRTDSALRALFGILIAQFIITKRQAFSFNPLERFFIIHRYSQDGWELERRFNLDHEVSKLVGQLKVAVPDDDGRITTKQAQLIISQGIKLTSYAFGNCEAAQRIRLAARWLFDSYATDQPLLAFVQAMVAMEILLGHGSEGSDISIGAIIRNRCAYLIALNADEREEIARNIKTIYQIRSNIVHTGKERLNSKEFGMLVRLRMYCARIIRKELELIRNN